MVELELTFSQHATSILVAADITAGDAGATPQG